MIDFLNPSAELLAGLSAGREESQEQIFVLLEQLEETEKENARLRAKLKITLNALKYVRDAKGVLIEGEIVDEILPAIEAAEEE